ELLLQSETDGAVAPAKNACDGPRVGVSAKVLVGDQHRTGTSVGELTAVEPSNPAFDHRIALPIKRFRHLPIARLSVRVLPRIAEVELGDGIQIGTVEAVAAVVFVGDI